MNYAPPPAIRINLRPASFADLDLLRHWDEQPHVILTFPVKSQKACSDKIVEKVHHTRYSN